MGNTLDLSLMIGAQDVASPVIQSIGKSLLSALGPGGAVVAGVAGTLIGIGVQATKMAADYQQSMNMVQALTGASNAQMAQYDAGLKQLAQDAGVAPNTLTKGLYQVLSAGYSGSEALNVLTLATKDAKIGMTDAATTGNALTTILKAFAVSAKNVTRVNGEMLETVTLGKMTMTDYANSVGKASSTAMQFHVSMENMNASIATMTANGVPSARQAVTDFNQALSVMYANIGTVTKSLNKNGIAFDESKFNAMSYSDKIKYLNTALQEAANKHVHITGVTKQAAQAIQILSQHSSEFAKNLGLLSDKQGMADKTQQAWAKTQSGFNQQMSRLNATFQVLMINLGEKILPIITQLAQEAIPVLLGAAKALGNWFQSDILPTFNDLYRSILPIMPELKQFAQFVGVVLLVAFQVLGNEIAGFVKFFAGAFQTIGGIIAFFVDLFTGHFNKLGGDLKVIVGGILKMIEGQFSGLTGMAPQWGANLINGFINGIKSMLGGVANAAQSVVQTVENFLGFHSPAKMGPGAQAHTWAPNLMKMFAQGLTDSKPILQKAVAQLGVTLQGTMAAPSILSGAYGGGQALSAAGIYNSTSSNRNISITINAKNANAKDVAKEVNKILGLTQRQNNQQTKMTSGGKVA